jgi:hypothetical protein
MSHTVDSTKDEKKGQDIAVGCREREGGGTEVLTAIKYKIT